MLVPRRRGHDPHKLRYLAKKQEQPKEAWSGVKMIRAGQEYPSQRKRHTAASSNASKRARRRILSKLTGVNRKTVLELKESRLPVSPGVSWPTERSPVTMPENITDWKQITSRIRRAPTSKD